jgi:thiamine-monophosphate kinase
MAMQFSEKQVIESLKRIFATSDPRVIVGIGDDAAITQGSTHQVITTDMAVEGTHFRRDWSSAFDIGRKVAAANIADVLAMGGKCDYLVAALSLTGDEELSWIEDLARGIKHEADYAGAHVVGGDLAKSSVITLAITAVGHCAHPITRAGARVGDSIYLSSLPGWSAAGYYILNKKSKYQSSASTIAVKEFQAPSIDYSINFTSAHSMCDLSDSLITQAEQLATASGVQLLFDKQLFEVSPEFNELSELAAHIGGDIWSWVVGGGEDHVLLATGLDLPGIRVGKVCEGAGVVGIDKKMAPDTWSHFSKD